MNRILSVLLILTSGCLLTADPPELIGDTWDYSTSSSSSEDCDDSDCRPGYGCEFGSCATDCVDDDACADGYYCCLYSNDCPNEDRVFECIPE